VWGVSIVGLAMLLKAILGN
jgi:hypothetical protein